jgi:hypothetical protein
MFHAFSPRRARLGLAAAGVLTLCGLFGRDLASAAGAPTAPSQVNAVYGISFNGFDIGSFAFQADMTPGTYRLTGDAEISALLGLVKWRGLTRSTGQVAGDEASPSAYTFDFSASNKAGSVRMAFHRGAVATVSASPPMPVTSATVPVEKSQLKGVLDPLSAVLALARPSGGDPCKQRLPVFDGMQRFDLVTSPLAVQQLPGKQGPLHVCEMRYRPISGYERGSATEDLALTMKIQIALRPVPGAGLFVPQEIKIPTLVGSAVMSLRTINIRVGDRDQIAFAE